MRARVGKTTCASAAAEAFGAELYELDELCRRRTNDWRFCHEMMLSVEAKDRAENRLKIVDIGAGTQHDCRDDLLGFLNTRRQAAMLIWAPVAEIIVRHPGRDHNEFEYTEYSSRERLYSIPKHRLNTSGLSKTQVEDAFKKYASSYFIS